MSMVELLLFLLISLPALFGILLCCALLTLFVLSPVIIFIITLFGFMSKNSY